MARLVSTGSHCPHDDLAQAFYSGVASAALATALAVATPAVAQSGEKNAESAGSANAGSHNVAEEIFVTAQRRKERFLDVPMAMTVQTAETLNAAGVSDTRDLAYLTPGLQINNSGGFITTALRGISSEVNGPGTDNNVAIYVDGVYLPSKNTGIFDFPDISSIEVLKGPQGTLYGRNATGGALLFKTADPSFDFGGSASFSYGSFNDMVFKTTVTGPLYGDKLAGSVSYFRETSDGQFKNRINNERTAGLRSWLVRGKFLLTPSDNVKFVLSTYYSDRLDKGTLAFTVLDGNTDGILIDPNAIITSKPRDVAHNNPTSLRNKTFGVSLQTEVNTAWGDLTSTTGYTDVDSVIVADADNTNVSLIDFVVTQPQKTFTEDLSFAFKPIGPVSLLAGASYFYDKGKNDPIDVIATNIPVFFIYSKVNTEALAGFVEADTKLTDRLHLILGVRTTYERKELFGSAGGVRVAAFPKIADKTWWNTTPRAAVKYKISDNTNVYASYSRGFKSGVFNATGLSPDPVNPEHVDAVEVGIKSAPTSSLTFDASFFHYQYKNIQVTTYNGVLTQQQNAAEAEVYGMDFDMTYRPVEDLTLSLALSPLHAKFKKFPAGSILVPNTACPPPFSVCGNVTASADLSGNRLVRAPKISGNFSIDYIFHLPASTLDFYANLYFTDKFAWEISNRIEEPAYHVLNAQATWRMDDSPWSVAIWGKNLTDQDYAAGAGIGADGDGLLWAPPLTFGGKVSVDF